MHKTFHAKAVAGRRLSALAAALAALAPPSARILDVGCGDGALARRLMDLRADLEIKGIDVLDRRPTQIPVDIFDGRTIPFGERSFDFVMFVDVLHHTENPAALLAEAVRVAGRGIILKDHLREGFLAGPTLRLMDWFANAPLGVALPYNYWTKSQWNAAFDALDLRPAVWRTRLGLYPFPASLVFERSLHFATLARIGPERE